MTIFDLINACAIEWDVIRIFTDGEKGETKDLGSFFKFPDIPEALLQSEVDTWAVNTYVEGGKVCEIDIFI